LPVINGKLLLINGKFFLDGERKRGMTGNNDRRDKAEAKQLLQPRTLTQKLLMRTGG